MAFSFVPQHVVRWCFDRRLRLLALFLGVLAPLFAFALIAEEVWDREGFVWDQIVLTFLHGRASSFLDRSMVVISHAGSASVLLPLEALLLVVLALRRRWGSALFLFLAVGGAALLNLIGKLSFHRARPDLWLSPAPESTFSFPSGHAMHSMALVTALTLLAWRTRWRWPIALAGGSLVIAVGLSRAYLGVHYPSDVLAGWAASLAWVVGLHLTLQPQARS